MIRSIGGGISQQAQKDCRFGEPMAEGIRPKSQRNREALCQLVGKREERLEVVATLCPKMIAKGIGPLIGSEDRATPADVVGRDRLHHHERLGPVGMGRYRYRRGDRLARAFAIVASMKGVDRDGFFVFLG